jgi:hypothetical protein
MYFVMLMLRFVLGCGSGRWYQLQLVPVRSADTCWLRPAATVPGDWNMGSGHLRIRTPIRSPIKRRHGIGPPVGLAFRRGLVDRLGAD